MQCTTWPERQGNAVTLFQVQVKQASGSSDERAQGVVHAHGTALTSTPVLQDAHCGANLAGSLLPDIRMADSGVRKVASLNAADDLWAAIAGAKHCIYIAKCAPAPAEMQACACSVWHASLRACAVGTCNVLRALPVTKCLWRNRCLVHRLLLPCPAAGTHLALP